MGRIPGYWPNPIPWIPRHIGRFDFVIQNPIDE
jgi:hypothetical protein